MSDRMTDERLARFKAWTLPAWSTRRELVDALVAERGRVVRLEAALTDLIEDVQSGRAARASWTQRAETVLAERDVT